MSHHQAMTVIGYGILVLLFSPILLGAGVILLTAIRERRQHLKTRGNRVSPPRIHLRETVQRKPLQVVERSAGGTVRVTPLPVPRLPGSTARNGKRRSP